MIKKIKVFYIRIKTHIILRKKIQNKRILIVGSGPSVKDINKIPKDVLVFSCNLGPEFLFDKKLKKNIDVYIVNKPAFKNYDKKIEDLLKKISIEIVLTRDIPFIKSKKYIDYEKVLLDRSGGKNNNYYLEKIIKPLKIDGIKEGSEKSNSTGVCLLQYAIFYKAKEIFISGVDLNIHTAGSALSSEINKKYEKAHLKIDENLLKYLSKTNKNIYCSSKSSPLTSIFPFKKLG